MAPRDKADGQRSKSSAQSREDRLKQALKANMARRKAQARARAATQEPPPEQTDDKEA